MSTKKTTAKSKTTDKISTTSLQNWNKYLAILHAAQAVLILILSASKAFPVTTNFLDADTLQTGAQGHIVLTTATHHLFDVNLAYLVAAFFFISAVAHALMATRLRVMYEKDLKKGINKVRWFEYTFSASTMIVAVGMLVGVQDLATLLMMFGLTAVMNLLGLVMEVHNQGAKKPNWLSYVVGCVAGALPWVTIVIYLVGGGVFGNKAPAFVYWIFVTIFLFFVSFAVNMYLQYRKIGKWTNYLYGERVYMILSLVAKTALAWQIFAGSLRP